MSVLLAELFDCDDNYHPDLWKYRLCGLGKDTECHQYVDLDLKGHMDSMGGVGCTRSELLPIIFVHGYYLVYSQSHVQAFAVI